MHSHLATALGHLETATRDLRAAVDAVPAPVRRQRPAPDRWSVNDVIEHVAKVEQVFLNSLMSNIEAARPKLGSEVAEPPMLPEQTATMVRDRTNKRSAPEPVHPTGQVEATTGLLTIDQGHAQLREALEGCEGLALSTVTHDHRFFGTLNVYQWIELLAGHEERHAAQVRETVAAITAR